ncbi:MAG: ATP-binding cassette domain-containing protein [Oscillospiraceae bacterium]
MEVFHAEDLTFAYPNSGRALLDHISFSVEAGTINLICGKTGCGKSTLLKLLKHIIAPCGAVSGEITYCGEPINCTDYRRLVTEIGYVSQSPDAQIVTDRVSSELAFGLENIGLPVDSIRRRVAETALYFGIGSWFDKEIATLSGGQKQLLNLAAVLAMRPKVLILDEPTAQLDPIARENFLRTILRLNNELGITIILCEHELEMIFPAADKVFLLDGGKLACAATPVDTAAFLLDTDHTLKNALPACTRICSGAQLSETPVLKNPQAIRLIEAACQGKAISLPEQPAPAGKPVFTAREITFRYEKNGADVLRNLSIKGFPNEILSIVGGNGAGKTTLLAVLSRARKPCTGKLSAANGATALLPQNPRSLFVMQTVLEDLLFTAKSFGLDENALYAAVAASPFFGAIPALFSRNPLDLSGGELQKLALCKLILTNPAALLLDEPSKGLDAAAKTTLCALLKSLKADGRCIVLVTHDLEFSALCSDRCAMLFHGEIISAGNPHAFFAQNQYYTTEANKLVQSIAPERITSDEVIAVCR